MIAPIATPQFSSIEELTIYSLEHSQEGLESLIRGSRKCSLTLSSDQRKAMSELLPLTNALHNFNIFQNDICSLFKLDRTLIADANGNLEAATTEFLADLDSMEKLLQKKDIKALSTLLLSKIPATLDRFTALLPLVSTYISREYVQSGA